MKTAGDYVYTVHSHYSSMESDKEYMVLNIDVGIIISWCNMARKELSEACMKCFIDFCRSLCLSQFEFCTTQLPSVQQGATQPICLQNPPVRWTQSWTLVPVVPALDQRYLTGRSSLGWSCRRRWRCDARQQSNIRSKDISVEIHLLS